MNNAKLCLIGLRGFAGSGKDSVGKYLIDNYQFKKIAFADPLKEVCSIISGWPLPLLNGDTKEFRDQRETLIHPIYGKTPRQLLQFVGTDLFRKHLDPNIWINIIDNRINQYSNEGYNRIVITDVRFPNEANLIQKHGGYIITVTRQNNDINITTEAASHESEQSFPIQSEIILQNDKSLNDLYCSIQDLINSNKINIT